MRMRFVTGASTHRQAGGRSSYPRADASPVGSMPATVDPEVSPPDLATSARAEI